MEKRESIWKVAGITNLASRLYCPLVSLTDGRVFRTVRLELDVDRLRYMTLREIEVVAVSLIKNQADEKS